MIVLRWVMYLSLLAVAYFAEKPLSFRQQKCTLEETTFEPSQPLSYNRVLDLGFRESRFRRVKVIALDEAVEPEDVMNNPCVFRMFLARLIRRLEEKGAAVITIDRWFPASSCPKDDPGTNQLRSVLNNGAVPVVLGLHTARVSANANTKSCTQLTQRLLFGQAETTGRLNFGLVRLDSDTRRLPLRWNIYSDGSDVMMPTLALSTAKLADPELIRERRLKFVIAQNIHPYSRLISSASYSAIRFLCGSSLDWKTCNSPVNSEDNDVRGKVVVVGFTGTTADIHHAESGDIPGVLLHANYIEALLDDSFYFPIPGLWLFIFWYGVMHLLFWRLKSPELAAGIALIFACFIWALGYFALTLMGLLLTSWLEVSILTFLLSILVRYVDARGHRGFS